MNLTSVFLEIKTYIVLLSLKSERKLVKIAHDSRQKLLQDEKACKNTSGNHCIAMQLVQVMMKKEQIGSLPIMERSMKENS